MTIRPLMALAAICLFSAPLAAQQINSPYRYIEETQSVELFAGYLFAAAGDPDLGPQSAPLFGATYLIRFSGPISGLLSAGFAPSERTVLANVAGTGSTDPVVLAERGTADAPLLFAEAGLQFRITGARTWNGLAPYLVAAGGLVADLGDDGGIEVEDDERFDFGPSLAVRVGGGAEWFASQRLSLRAEARDHIWKISTPDGLLEPGKDDSRWTNNFVLTFGAAYHF